MKPKKKTISPVEKKLDEIIRLLEENLKLSTVKPVYQSENLIRLDMKDTMTASSLFAECQTLFPCWKSDYLDLNNITSQRKGNYTVYFKDVQEADEENANLSADDIKAKGMKTITLEERLLLEITYFKKYGKHLDEKNWTLCAGSRDRDGYVPEAYWRDGEFGVGWCWSDYRYAGTRARSAVSFRKVSCVAERSGVKRD